MTTLSDRVQRIQPSPTLAVSARAAELRAAGQNIIGLSVGEPDFNTPPHIIEAAKKALDDGFTRYTPVDGLPSLKDAIINKLSRENQLTYEPKQVLVSCGAKHTLFNLTQALLNQGDEVIIPAPYWVSYPDMVKYAGGKPILLQADIKQNYKITPEQLAQAITPKTRLLFLNSPCNPTGMAYTRHELKAFADILLQHPHLIIASDDIYEHILWSKESFSSILNVCPELYNRTLVINGVSKAYAMTGWRIGYAAGPAEIIAAMKKIQSQSTSNPTVVAQKAAEAALNGDQRFLQTMLNAFKERHDFVYNELKNMSGIHCLPAQGTFYSFPCMQGVIERIDGLNNDIELAEYLLNKAHVAVVPGSAFGMPSSIRLSFAASMDILREALTRIREAVTA